MILVTYCYYFIKDTYLKYSVIYGVKQKCVQKYPGAPNDNLPFKY